MSNSFSWAHWKICTEMLTDLQNGFHKYVLLRKDEMRKVTFLKSQKLRLTIYNSVQRDILNHFESLSFISFTGH